MKHDTRASRRLRGLAAVAVAAGLSLLAAGCGQSAPKPAPPPVPSASAVPGEVSADTSQSAVSGGALFGGNTPLAAEAAKLGRRLAIVRIYDTFGDSFPGSNSQFLASGSTALVSLDSNGPSYASIAAGDEDGEISSFLKSVNRAALQYHLSAIYVSFEHEPDNPKHHRYGTPAQFIQAWDHVHQLAASDHLNWNDGGRLHWVLILIHSSFSNGRASRFFPGAGEVDGLGADGYDTLACREASGYVTAKQRAQVTPNAIFDPAISFAEQQGGLPVFISEWGSDDPGSSTQPEFIRAMQDFVAANPEIAAVMYWDSGGTGCNYSVNSSSSSVAALAAMARSRALAGHVFLPR
jgi:hypothetical protein